MRNILFLLTILFSLPSFAEQTDPPAEPKYKISDIDMQIFVRYMNNIEQCIFPELTNNPNPDQVYDKWSFLDRVAMYFFQNDLLNEIVGEQNRILIRSDKASKDYFWALHYKWNHQIAAVDPDKCDRFKSRYKLRKEIIQCEIDKAKQEK